MGSWYGTKLGIKVRTEDIELAEKFLETWLDVGIGVDDMHEEIGNLSNEYLPNIECQVFEHENLGGIMPRLEKRFSEYKKKCGFFDEYEEYEEEEDEDENDEREPLTLEDVFLLLNKIFPQTYLYLAHEDGNNTSDDFYRYEVILNPITMKKTTLECFNSYGQGINLSGDTAEKTIEDIPEKQISNWFVKYLIYLFEDEVIGSFEIAERLKACI